jgi:hypothetical protein
MEASFTYDRRPAPHLEPRPGDAARRRRTPDEPNIGQGAAQALEDAVALGICATEKRHPEAILREYEYRRIRRANAVVRASRRAGRAAEVRSHAAARLRDAAMKALPDRLADARTRGIVQFRRSRANSNEEACSPPLPLCSSPRSTSRLPTTRRRSPLRHCKRRTASAGCGGLHSCWGSRSCIPLLTPSPCLPAASGSSSRVSCSSASVPPSVTGSHKPPF